MKEKLIKLELLGEDFTGDWMDTTDCALARVGKRYFKPKEGQVVKGGAWTFQLESCDGSKIKEMCIEDLVLPGGVDEKNMNRRVFDKIKNLVLSNKEEEKETEPGYLICTEFPLEELV